MNTKDLVDKTITQAKWMKAKEYLKELRLVMETRDHPGPVSHKLLERIRGYLNHIALTYEIISPFLEDFTILSIVGETIDIWKIRRIKTNR